MAGRWQGLRCGAPGFRCRWRRSLERRERLRLPPRHQPPAPPLALLTSAGFALGFALAAAGSCSVAPAEGVMGEPARGPSMGTGWPMAPSSPHLAVLLWLRGPGQAWRLLSDPVSGLVLHRDLPGAVAASAAASRELTVGRSGWELGLAAPQPQPHRCAPAAPTHLEAASGAHGSRVGGPHQVPAAQPLGQRLLQQVLEADGVHSGVLGQDESFDGDDRGSFPLVLGLQRLNDHVQGGGMQRPPAPRRQLGCARGSCCRERRGAPLGTQLQPQGLQSSPEVGQPPPHPPLQPRSAPAPWEPQLCRCPTAPARPLTQPRLHGRTHQPKAAGQPLLRWQQHCPAQGLSSPPANLSDQHPSCGGSLAAADCAGCCQVGAGGCESPLPWHCQGWREGEGSVGAEDLGRSERWGWGRSPSTRGAQPLSRGS